MIFDLVGKELFVRSIANLVNDNLIMIGGGVVCYVFGIKFSELLTINLFLVIFGDVFIFFVVDEEKIMYKEGSIIENGIIELCGFDYSMNSDGRVINGDIGYGVKDIYWVLKI